MSTRDIMMILLGVMGCKLYTKYNKPVMECLDNMIDNTLKMTNKKMNKIK